MGTVVVIFHSLVCIILVIIILMQSGRGGGLTEGFASTESMFGAQTNEYMIRATSIAATLFLVTCVSLAVISSKKEKSLMSTKVAAPRQMEINIPAVEGKAEKAAVEGKSIPVTVEKKVDEAAAESQSQ